MKRSDNRRITKKYLKTLTNEKGSGFRTFFRIIKYGFISFGRNIWLSLASILVMTITILILFATVLAGAVLSETATSMRDKIDITIFLKPETTEETLAKLGEVLEADSNIKSDTIIKNTSKDELELFLTEKSENKELIETLTEDDMNSIMLKTMQSTIRFKVYDPENLDSIKSLVKNNDLFKNSLDEEKSPTYDMNKIEIEKISSWANIAKNGGIILSSVFLAISILIIFNTIRMAIFSRREEIYMMKLIGANRSFIKGPFLVEAQFSGLISGIIASVLGSFSYKFLIPKLTSYGISTSTIDTIFKAPNVYLFFTAMILIGIIVGSISARLALKKYLRKL